MGAISVAGGPLTFDLGSQLSTFSDLTDDATGNITVAGATSTGNIVVNSNGALSLPRLTSVAGYVETGPTSTTSSSGSFSAPLLQSVGSHLYAFTPSTLDALSSVGGLLWVGNGASGSFTFPSLVTSGGVLVNSPSVTAVEFPSLTTCTGDFEVTSTTLLAKVTAPVLKSVTSLAPPSPQGIYFSNNADLPHACVTELCNQVAANGYSGACGDYTSPPVPGSCPY